MSNEGWTQEEADLVFRAVTGIDGRNLAIHEFTKLKDVILLDVVTRDTWRGEVEVVDIRVKRTEDHPDPWMTIVKGISGDGLPVICFHSGGSPVEALAGAARRLQHGKMKWREDEYRTGKR